MWPIDSTSPAKDSEAVPGRLDGAGSPGCRWVAGIGEVPTAAGAALTIHVPEGLQQLEDRELLILAVGENAALPALREGIPCIGLQNAWAWAVGLSDEDQQEVADVEAPTPASILTMFARLYRRVLVLGGSGLLEDDSDRRGLELLAAALRNRDIRAQLAYCPSGVVLERGQRRITHRDLYEWLNSADRRFVKLNLSALFFAAEVSGCFGITDSFNARTIADLFRNELAYSRGCWYVWDGCIWRRDSDETRRKLAVRVAELYQMYAERLQKLVATATGAYGKRISRIRSLRGLISSPR